MNCGEPTVMKISAIHQGGDWVDSSASYLVIPDSVDVLAENKKRDIWWRSVWSEKSVEYLDLQEWLLKIPGVRKPTSDELKVYDLT